MKYFNLNTFSASFMALISVAACAEKEFDIVVAEEDTSLKSVYNPWYPDTEQEDVIVLEEMPRDDWDEHVTAKIDKTYNGYFTRDMGMNGCDGVYSTELPDGNTFWSFGDSYFGMLQDPTLRIRGGNESNFPRNAVIIQTRQNHTGFHCLNELVEIDDRFSPDYYKGRTYLRSPRGEQTEKDILAGKIDQQFYYWPGDATVIERDGKHILQVLWGECYKTADGGMGRYGTAMTEHDLDSAPGEGYMDIISYKTEFIPYITNYGSALYEAEDGYTYIYGEAPHSDGMGKGPVVARVKGGDLNGQWEYYVNEGMQAIPDFKWRTEVPTREELIKSRIMDDWGVQPNVFKSKTKDWYYMVSQTPMGEDVWIYRSKTPYGPFNKEPRKCIFRFPDTMDKVGKIGNSKRNSMYNVFVHHGLSEEGELVISFNTDAPGFEANFNSIGCADYYRPYFFRLYGWEDVWGD